MRRWLSLLVLVVCAVSGCGQTETGQAMPAWVIGVSQTSHARGLVDVVPQVLVDPAPVFKNVYGLEPAAGTHLVAVRWSLTNTGPDDVLIGTAGETHYLGSDGKRYEDSLVETTAGPKLGQLRLAPKQTMVGFVTAEIPDGVTVDKVEFAGGYRVEDELLTWDAAGRAVKKAPETPTRRSDRPETTPLGTEREVAGGYQGANYKLLLAATKITDPAQPRAGMPAVEGLRFLAVDFAVRNDGGNTYDDQRDHTDYRIFAVHDTRDEEVTSLVYGAFAEKGGPLAPGEANTWTIYFQVPTDFRVDRVSFSPSFGNHVTTIWTVP